MVSSVIKRLCGAEGADVDTMCREASNNNRPTIIAGPQPRQAVNELLTKSFQLEWAYLQGVILNCVDAFAPLCEIIKANSSQPFLGSISEQVILFTCSLQ